MRGRIWSTEVDYLPQVLLTDAKVISSVPRGDSVDVLVQTIVRSAVPLLTTTFTYRSNAGIKAIGISDSLISEQGLKRTYFGLATQVTDRVWLRLPTWNQYETLIGPEDHVGARVWVEARGVSHRDMFAVAPESENTVFVHQSTVWDEREVLMYF